MNKRPSATVPGAPARARGLARVWRFTDPSTGMGWFAFDTAGGTVYQQRTPLLAGALSRLRMGEVVVDDNAARAILDKFEEMARWVRAAEDARRSNPAGAESSDLTASIEGYWAALDRDGGSLESLRTKANRAILTRAWESAPDKDLRSLDAFHMMARELAEQAKAVSPGRPGAPPSPAGNAGAGVGTLGMIGIGLGVVSVLFGGATLVYNLVKAR
jgi:hypothetical protein